MQPSARIAYEELARKGWQDAAADAWSRWALGQPYDTPAGVDRFTAALIGAANWDVQQHERERAQVDSLPVSG